MVKKYLFVTNNLRLFNLQMFGGRYSSNNSTWQSTSYNQWRTRPSILVSSLRDVRRCRTWREMVSMQGKKKKKIKSHSVKWWPWSCLSMTRFIIELVRNRDMRTMNRSRWLWRSGWPIKIILCSKLSHSNYLGNYFFTHWPRFIQSQHSRFPGKTSPPFTLLWIYF